MAKKKLQTLKVESVNEGVNVAQVTDAEKGSVQNPYTIAELETMLEAGTWQGGYVESVGYNKKMSIRSMATSDYGYGDDWGGTVDLTNSSYFIGWHHNADCYQLSSGILNNYGIHSNCSYNNSIKLTNASSGYPIPSGNSNVLSQGIHEIDRHLDAGRPIMVGVHYGNTAGPNPDGTRQFVIITGRLYSSQGGVCYRFMDCGSWDSAKGCSPSNLLFIDSSVGSLVGTSQAMSDVGVMTVTQIRTNF